VLTIRLPKAALVPVTTVLLATATGCSKGALQERMTAIDLPTLEVPESNYDFGQVEEGGKLTHVFTLKNLGGGVLHIDQVRSSCGCTAAAVKTKEIAPHGEGQIEVTFDTNHRSGDQRKSITVTSDDPIRPSVNLEIHASVEVLLALQPQFIQLSAEIGKTQVIDAWLTGKLKEKAHLKIQQKPADHELAVKIIEQTLDGGVGVQGLRFTISSKKSGSGSGNVSFETGIANLAKLQVGYSWAIKGNIEVSPAQLLFTNGKGDSLERVLHVTSRNADFKLQQARIVSGPFVANIETPDSGVDYAVRVSLKKGVAPTVATVASGTLELVSNDPLEPKREVLIKFAPSVAPSTAP
jgi:hypothetical protein